MSPPSGEFRCRVCLKQDELLVDIYEIVEEMQVDLCTLLETCGGIKVDRRNVQPMYLCQECTNELLIAAKFRKKCEDSEKLRDMAREISMDTAERLASEEIIIIDPSDYIEQFFAVEDPENEPIGVARWNCQHCGAGFQQSEALRRHIQKVHASITIIDCRDCRRIFTKVGCYQVHNCSHAKSLKRKHKCLECGKCLQSASSLASHIRLHTDERAFTCDQCAKAFRTNGALQAHLRRHKQVMQHKCPHCGRGFVESSNLRRHIVARHTEERPHLCNFCQRSFSRVYMLELHLRTHTGERPYACQHCEKRFAQLGVLKSHERIHTGERLHRCQVCEKTFTRAGQLRKHALRHETGQ
ncbi:zinc finger protein 700 isoform X1 [Drosophila sechellia]|uniref:Protein krueppel n=2 Tax=Drosophila sechellia TaxID=7238 RepID=B4HLK4_DROSE|nr:zinc finger protein 700 isoform X1 [Drosophila sechellia]EDW43031.1 GM23733 [Drosophila sechellia]